MKHKEPKFIRRGHLIDDLTNKTTENFKTINAAKRASRKIQKDADGNTGLGVLRVQKD